MVHAHPKSVYRNENEYRLTYGVFQRNFIIAGQIIIKQKLLWMRARENISGMENEKRKKSKTGKLIRKINLELCVPVIIERIQIFVFYEKIFLAACFSSVNCFVCEKSLRLFCVSHD